MKKAMMSDSDTSTSRNRTEMKTIDEELVALSKRHDVEFDPRKTGKN
jgi:hypothetical protein